MNKKLPKHLQGLQPVGNLGKITIRKGVAINEGACNFCDGKNVQRGSPMHVLSGDRLEVRICETCLRVIKAQELALLREIRAEAVTCEDGNDFCLWVQEKLAGYATVSE